MKYVKGDLLQMFRDGQLDIIIHGCNIHNTMGSGIAAQIREQFPVAWKIDQLTEPGDIRKLGCFTMAVIHDLYDDERDSYPCPAIVNLYTQATFGRTGVHVDLQALERGLYSLKTCLVYSGSPRIGIPQIGAGFGGGNWNEIEKVIDSIGFKDITCVIYDKG